MSDSASAIGDIYAGDQSSVGITQTMGNAPPTYGDYFGPGVFDNAGGTGGIDSSVGANQYNYSGVGNNGIVSDVSNGPGGLFGSGIPLSQIASLAGQGLSLGTGINALSQARQLGQTAAQGAAQADPLMAYRPELAARLMNLVRDPSSITNDPGYGAGLQAVQRAGAAQGFTGSGNMMSALSNYGGQFYQQAIQRLAGLTGGSAGAGAALNFQGQQSAVNLANAGFNRIGSGIASMATGL